MIRRFAEIRDSWIFRNYRWSDALPNLEQVSVIFGSNGSGKTSLARAVAHLQRNGKPSEGTIELLVDSPSGPRRVSSPQDQFLKRVLVFSDDFVNENHRLSHEDAELSAILTIGKQSIEAEQRLRDVVTEIERLTSSIEGWRKQSVDAERNLGNIYTRVADMVVASVSRAGGKYQSRGHYRSSTVREQYEESREGWRTVSEDTLTRLRSIVNADERTPVVVVSGRIEAPTGLRERIESALGESPATLVLDTLSSYPHAAQWVRQGVDLHDGTCTCIFCGSTLTDARREQLNAHFSDAVGRLQANLSHIRRELDDLEELIRSTMKRLPDAGSLFPDLQADLTESATDLEANALALSEWINTICERIQAKESNLLVGDLVPVPKPPTIDCSAVQRTLEQHNARAARFATEVSEAARCIELHYLKDAEHEVDNATAEYQQHNDRIAEHEERLRKLRSEEASLSSVDGDPVPSADVLTREVARLLGRHELTFESVGDRYKVSRDGRPATSLSQGERTAIALVHFLEKVARSAHGTEKPIAIVDDPVSSLDANIKIGVSTYLWSECVIKQSVAQLILLTHDFELFRQWDIQLESAGRSSKLKARTFELRARHIPTPSGPRRTTEFAAWPPSGMARKKVRSTYHHAFITLSDAKTRLDREDSLENRLDAQLLFPNVVRRTLESFLAFKQPDFLGDFTGSMRAASDRLRASGYGGNADALRTRLVRFTHTFSHSESPSVDDVVSPDEVHTTLTAAFTFMRILDPEHFDGLCNVLDLDPDSLVDAPAAPEQRDVNPEAT